MYIRPIKFILGNIYYQLLMELLKLQPIIQSQIARWYAPLKLGCDLPEDKKEENGKLEVVLSV